MVAAKFEMKSWDIGGAPDEDLSNLDDERSFENSWNWTAWISWISVMELRKRHRIQIQG